MKRLKLRKWVKQVITIILLAIAVIIYQLLGIKGVNAGKNIISDVMLCLGWFWLIIGQIAVLYILWEN